MWGFESLLPCQFGGWGRPMPANSRAESAGEASERRTGSENGNDGGAGSARQTPRLSPPGPAVLEGDAQPVAPGDVAGRARGVFDDGRRGGDGGVFRRLFLDHGQPVQLCEPVGADAFQTLKQWNGRSWRSSGTSSTPIRASSAR